MATTDIPRVRVVVVAYHSGDVIGRCLGSLESACTAPYDVVVVNNGGPDPELERAVAPARAHVITSEQNLGYGRAVNLGARMSPRTDWILVCNPDVEFSVDAVDILLEAGSRWPDAGSLGPAILEPDGRVYPSARALPTLGMGVGHALLGPVWPTNPWTASYLRRHRLGTEGPAGWLSGACLLVRRRAWEEVQGFDSRYFMYFEDVDLGERMGRAGWQNVYVPAAEVTHTGGTSTARVSTTMLHAHHASAATFVRDRYPRVVAGPVAAGLRLRSAMLSRREASGLTGAAEGRRGPASTAR